MKRIAIVFLAACGSAPPPASPSPPAVPCPASDRRVAVVDSGTEPRRALRYRYTKSVTQRFTLAVRESSTTLPAGAPRVMTGEIEVVEVLPDDSAKIEIHLAGTKSFAQVELDRCGAIRKFQGQLLATALADDQETLLHVRDALSMMRPAVPDEPIGANARWTTTSDQSDLVKFTEQLEYRLAGDPDHPTFQLEFNNPIGAQIPGKDTTITSGTHAGSGSGSLTMDELVPVHASETRRFDFATVHDGHAATLDFTVAMTLDRI